MKDENKKENREQNNDAPKDKKNSKKVSDEQNRRMEELSKKKRMKLSIISYALGVFAVILGVLFIAKATGSDAWFVVICDFFCGLFSYAGWATPVIMIYCAVCLPKIVKKKSNIWRIVLATFLLINVSINIGLCQSGRDISYNFIDVFKNGVALKGSGVFGTYFSWLFIKAISLVGAWVLVIALYFALMVFLLGLPLDDALSFVGKKLWSGIKALSKKIFRSIFTRKKKTKKSSDDQEDEDENGYEESEEEEDDRFIPPAQPKKGTKYYNKPIQEKNPYAEDEENGSAPAEDPQRTGNEQQNRLPQPQVVPRPAIPAGWNESASERAAQKEESLPKIKPKGATSKGNVDLDEIFSENYQPAPQKAPAQVETFPDDEEEEELSQPGTPVAENVPSSETVLEARRSPLISAVEDNGEQVVAKQYLFPPVNLLTAVPVKHVDPTEELNSNATKLVEALRSFKVRTKVVNISRGPTITRYELQPEEGVRVRAIANLVDDIALNLATSGVRIEAPILGKAAVGVEVPNKVRETVYLRTLLEDKRFENSPAKLTAAVGVDVAGEPVYVDLAKMPHLLIAGTTGSGKSVCMNCLILSMLYKASPDEVKMIMIDPKKVEFSVYNGLPHLIVPVVSNAKKAAGALAWAVSEMERRYEVLEGVGVRDIRNYNKLTANDPDKEFMPQLVIIIDELADLMMTASNEVEESICRIAQKGRASGMHLIIGTQRPSVDVITGLIKANVPSRIAFTTSSQIDSRTIIDIAGAEKLIGRGDMLFAPIGAMKPARLQGAFVSDEEVEAVTSYIIENSEEAVYDDKVMSDIEKEAALCGSKGKKNSGAEIDFSGDEDKDTDPMLKAAIDLAVETGKISTSLIQRRLQLGYGRAAKLIDEMENRGIVSQPEGQKPRSVLISAAEWQEMCMRAEE